MKYRTTQREIKANYNTIIKVGYCELQFLLNFESPEAYTCGRDGWNADIYGFGGVAIVTGYSPFGNIYPDYDTLRKYDEAARDIYNNTPDYTEKKTAVQKLIKDFITEVIEHA